MELKKKKSESLGTSALDLRLPFHPGPFPMPANLKSLFPAPSAGNPSVSMSMEDMHFSGKFTI